MSVIQARRLFLIAATLAAVASPSHAQVVRITQKPQGLVHGDLLIPISTTAPVVRTELLVNGAKWADTRAQSSVTRLRIGNYIRRLRIRAVGYDAANMPIGQDEMVVNDPRPPFRVHLEGPSALPEHGAVTLSANVLKPSDMKTEAVEFFMGEEKVATVANPPFNVALDSAKFQHAVYARVVARSSSGEEANDVLFFGTQPRDQIDVTLQQIPLSVASGSAPLRLGDLTLTDDGHERHIEALVPAADQPLHVILLIDYSESMLEELPVVKAAARQFTQRLLRPNDRIAVVGFNQTMFWLTGWTNDKDEVARAVEATRPQGETHLYDSAISCLYELQKQEGRHALVLLTDGVDQGSEFNLDNLVHYARYAGIPVYPIIKNRRLTTLMRFGVGRVEARKLDNIARDTGATYFIIQKEAELPAVYERLAAELRQQYQVEFYSDPSSLDEWHSLAMVNRSGLQLRIPKGYFP